MVTRIGVSRHLLAVSMIAGVLLLSACGWLTPTTRTPRFTSNLKDPEIGVRYDYNASTHCAFYRLRIDGEMWVPVEGTIAREGNNFGITVDQGSVILTDADHGTYTAEAGFDVPIERVVGPEPRFPDCM